MLVPLINIGATIGTSQGLLSGLSHEFGLPVNLECLVLMTAVMVGAGTDYAVFLISRYHDYVWRGRDSDQAVRMALMSSMRSMQRRLLSRNALKRLCAIHGSRS